MKQRDAHEVLTKPLNTASMIIARGASAVARRESRSHSMLRSPSHSLFSGGVTSHVTAHRVCGVTQRRAAAASCLVPGCHPAPEGAQAPSGQGRSVKGGEIGAGWSGTPVLQCPQFPRCTHGHAKSCVEAQRRAERDASCRIEYESGQSRGSRDLSGGGRPRSGSTPIAMPIACGEGQDCLDCHGQSMERYRCFLPVQRLRGEPVPFPTGSRPRGAVDSGLAAVLAAVDVLSRSRFSCGFVSLGLGGWL